jgi:starch-binding outer membrane protein, SusD/RagB family
MKSKIKTLNKGLWCGLLCTILVVSQWSCEIDDLVDPNNPDLNNIESNASLSEIQNLVDGIESWMRDRLGTHLDGVGVIGREYYRFSGSDPRLTSDLLGKGNAILDNNTFYTTRPFESRYRVVKNANILLNAIENTSAAVTNEQTNATRGFAKTIQAHQLLTVLMRQYTCGIRIDVNDPDNLGPFLDFNASLNQLESRLNEANSELLAGGSAFPFTLSSGFNDFDTPATFSRFNRAIAARLHVYQQKWQEALTALDNSFFSLNGDFNSGVYHIFSQGGGDQLNPMWFPFNESAETRVAHNSYVEDALANDDRLNKVRMRAATGFQDGLSSDYDLNIYQSNTDPIPMIRNEELILIYAEAKAQTGAMDDAIEALDIIRTTHGVDSYSGGNTLDDLIDEILFQRRYSLFGEGHRFYDMRRYDRLGDLPIDRVDDNVWMGFPRPLSENSECDPN